MTGVQTCALPILIADDIWDMILGKAGKLPGEVAPEIKKLAEEQGRVFFTGNPQDSYPDALNKYKELMSEKEWPLGQDDEELFEYAMHPAQYEAYKSGKAKADFEADLEKKKAEANKGKNIKIEPQTIVVEVDGQKYSVGIAPDDGSLPAADIPVSNTTGTTTAGDLQEITSPLEGTFFLSKGTESPRKIGDKVKKGEPLCYVEAMKTYNAIMSPSDGEIVEICIKSGDKVYEEIGRAHV